MPLDRLSEKDRSRLAELLQGPVIPVAEHPEPPSRWNWRAAFQRTADRYAHRRNWIIGGATGVALLTLLAFSIRVGKVCYPVTPQLQVKENQGKLQLRWDTGSDQVRYAREGTLFITDGAEKLFVTLDAAHLRRGRVSYARQTGRVEFRMALKQPDGQVIEQKAVYLGMPVDQERPQLEAAAPPEASPATPPTVPVAVPVAAEPPRISTGHRSRRKPLALTGTNLPFTCSTGDTFRKVDAPSGWDTFTCRGNNVWSITRTQLEEPHPAHRPNATTLTAKPASTSTT